MTLTEAILSLHPSAHFGSEAQGGDFVVGQTLDDKGAVGPEAVLWWNEATLGARDDAAIAAAVAKAGPTLPRSATAYVLLNILTDAQRAAYVGVKDWDQRRLAARGSDLVPENNPIVGRAAQVLGTTPKAWFDAALGVIS